MKKEKKIVQINGIPVMAEKENVRNGKAVLTVFVGSTGFCGGDRRAGGRTYVSLENAGAADMMVNLVKDKNGDGTGFEIAASGDAELMSIAYVLAAMSEMLINTMTAGEEE